MFQNIALFSKQHNIISAAGPHWTPKVRIYCTCTLDTALVLYLDGRIKILSN
ncbi:hypothetical protein Cpin_2505 [Chitinophaga pinensis DSM 2588]|uniref:Uncharacterized protein n=1 Tax=Chitinophaga pinensis (strain ATCC 43595 / DSM 2588 / LMG 13176 / NBRC 15968 / NCIMB 11800 / UQM 2034) TaxID=485918 RepID=A0A979G3G9_CHIPD|nr:hypothetical protein Cpin_2505 [Chitinophaga pinensis DSM 2588]